MEIHGYSCYWKSCLRRHTNAHEWPTNGPRMTHKLFAGNWITRRNLCLISNKNSNNTSWKFWHYVLCFAIVRNLVGSLLPPSSCQRQNIFSRISKLSRSKNRKEPMRSLFFSVSVVFAFADSRAWNATVGIDGEWRKLVYSQTPSIPNDKSWKDWNQQKGYSCFCENRTTGIYKLTDIPHK